MQNNAFSSLFVGKNLIHLNQCASTNQYALDLLSNSTPVENGSIILTDCQTDGRGQMGNAWVSEPFKSLTFSIILNNVWLKSDQLYLLNIVSALAILDVLAHFNCPKRSVKWPNDIYIDNKKVAGILIQNQIKAEKKVNSVVGIGINVNQSDFNALPQASSMMLALGIELEINNVLKECIAQFEKYYLQLTQVKGIDQLLIHYHKQMYKIGEESKFLVKGEIRTGVILGINPQGRLRVKIENDEQIFDLKEISMLHD